MRAGGGMPQTNLDVLLRTDTVKPAYPPSLCPACLIPAGFFFHLKSKPADVLKKFASALDWSKRHARLASDHPHDGPRTWIRGRMAPRRLRPAGLFQKSEKSLASVCPCDNLRAAYLPSLRPLGRAQMWRIFANLTVDAVGLLGVYVGRLIAPRWISRKASGGVIFCTAEVMA